MSEIPPLQYAGTKLSAIGEHLHLLGIPSLELYYDRLQRIEQDLALSFKTQAFLNLISQATSPEIALTTRLLARLSMALYITPVEIGSVQEGARTKNPDLHSPQVSAQNTIYAPSCLPSF